MNKYQLTREIATEPQKVLTLPPILKITNEQTGYRLEYASRKARSGKNLLAMVFPTMQRKMCKQ